MIIYDRNKALNIDNIVFMEETSKTIDLKTRHSLYVTTTNNVKYEVKDLSLMDVLNAIHKKDTTLECGYIIDG